MQTLRASLLRDTQQNSQPALDEVFGWMAQEVQSRAPEGRHPIVMVMDGQETFRSVGRRGGRRTYRGPRAVASCERISGSG